MNVGELREALNHYPDDMPVAVIDEVDGSLDTYAELDVAVNHPDVWFDRKSWHWRGSPRIPRSAEDGVLTLVLY